ncbi:MAG TPA: 2-hydroxyacyl-CoA dehydratase family protein [Candidatus Dormibacteraeota bacterium]|nr:2-hydroxyacyl-CoA dehydratase family protein [Candidatus Dormibacteraeota bacterium]
MATDPIAQLGYLYQNPMSEALQASASGVPLVGITSNTVPWELIASAGMYPVMLRSDDCATSFADEFMEPQIFLPRIRSIFDQILSGRWPLRAVIIPRTSEQEYKLFLYVREVSRQYPEKHLPPVYLYDLPHSRSQDSRAYGLKVTFALKAQLEAIGGISIGADEIAASIVESNAARSAVRSLVALRRGKPRIDGCLALSLIGPFWSIPRKNYTELAWEAAAKLQAQATLNRPRILVKGVSMDQSTLHGVLESCGALVVSEDDWWGEGSAGQDISTAGDPVAACFEKYYSDSPGPRTFPASVADSWFEDRSRDGIDGVVFYLPQEDYVFGWDYPRQKNFLDALGIPNLLIRDDPRQLKTPELSRVQSWLEQLPKVVQS